jgi:hypothetical protein
MNEFVGVPKTEIDLESNRVRIMRKTDLGHVQARVGSVVVEVVELVDSRIWMVEVFIEEAIEDTTHIN